MTEGMNHGHTLHHEQNHYHHDHQNVENMGDRRLGFAIVINILLTVVQVIGGVVSGSLSLIADALHNFSDASSLLIAYAARKIGRQPADHSADGHRQPRAPGGDANHVERHLQGGDRRG